MIYTNQPLPRDKGMDPRATITFRQALSSSDAHTGAHCAEPSNHGKQKRRHGRGLRTLIGDGVHAAAGDTSGQLTTAPHGSAPTMRNDEDTTRQWLTSHGLSPLIDLRQLRKTLDAPGIGWPGGTATPAQLLSPVCTPAGLANMLQSTPASQHKTLPTPGFLDFGAPAAPAAKEFYWRNSDSSVAPATAAATAAAFEAGAWAAEADNTSDCASARQPDATLSLPTQPVPAQTVYRKLALPPCLPRLQPADEPSSSAPSAPCHPAQSVTPPTLPTVRACAEEAASEPPAEERPTASSLSGTHSPAALADRPRRSRRRRVLASEYVWDNEHDDDAANAAAT